jgi:hypothetical protein
MGSIRWLDLAVIASFMKQYANLGYNIRASISTRVKTSNPTSGRREDLL